MEMKDFLGNGKARAVSEAGLYLRLEEQQRDAYGYKTVADGVYEK